MHVARCNMTYCFLFLTSMFIVVMHTLSRQNNTTVQVMQSQNEFAKYKADPAKVEFTVDSGEELSTPDCSAITAGVVEDTQEQVAPQTQPPPPLVKVLRH